MQWLKRWWPALAWAVVISCFSTGAFTSEHTSRIIIPVLHWLFPHASTQTLHLIHHYIRKCAHFTEYFILSLLVLRGIRAGRPGTRLRVGAGGDRASWRATRRSMSFTSVRARAHGGGRRCADRYQRRNRGAGDRGAADAAGGTCASDAPKRGLPALKAVESASVRDKAESPGRRRLWHVSAIGEEDFSSRRPVGQDRPGANPDFGRSSRAVVAASYFAATASFSSFSSGAASSALLRGFFSFFFSSEPRNSRMASSAPSPMRHPVRMMRV